MTTVFPKKNPIKTVLLVLAIALPTYVVSAEDYYSSQLVNESKHAGSNGFRLVKTKMWPNSTCVVDAGKEVVNPGETTDLKIKNAKECSESGVGYSMYKIEDTKNEHLLGYLSHRFGEGKFSVQISRFCEGVCVFRDLNPQQNKK